LNLGRGSSECSGGMVSAWSCRWFSWGYVVQRDGASFLTCGERRGRRGFPSQSWQSGGAEESGWLFLLAHHLGEVWLWRHSTKEGLRLDVAGHVKDNSSWCTEQIIFAFCISRCLDTMIVRCLSDMFPSGWMGKIVFTLTQGTIT